MRHLYFYHFLLYHLDGGYGGAIYLNNGAVGRFSAATFLNNKAVPAVGGALFVHAGADAVFDDGKSKFEGNQAGTSGSLNNQPGCHLHFQ